MKLIRYTACLLLTFTITTGLLAQKPAPAKKKTVKGKTRSKPKAKYPADGDSAFMLKGFTPSFPDSLLVTVVSMNNNTNYQGPSSIISNGQFLLTGSIPEPGMYNLVLSNPKHQEQNRYVNVFLANEPSAIRFTGNAGSFEVLEGASLKAFSTLVQNFGPYFDTLSRLQQLRQTPGTNPDSINVAWSAIADKVIAQTPAFIKENRNTPVAPYLLCIIWPIASSQVDKVEGWVKAIDTNALKNDFGAAINEYVANEKLLGYGQVAPDFTQNDTQGIPVALKSFRGKYVLVDFWASWCGPCRLENPNVLNAYNKYKDKNFTVLGVSLDKERSKWLQAIQQDQLFWTHVSDLSFWNNAAAKLYKVQSIPQNFLLDPGGKIIAKNLRGEALDNFLAGVLNKN